VPATVVGTVGGGVVDGPLVDDRRGRVRATVGRVVADLVVSGAVGASVGAGVASVVGCVVTSCGVMSCAAARAQRAPPVSAAIAHRHMTATGRDTRRCLPLAARRLRGDRLRPRAAWVGTAMAVEAQEVRSWTSDCWCCAW